MICHAYFKELKEYSWYELKSSLRYADDGLLDDTIGKLVEKGVVRVKKGVNSRNKYSINFVGVIVVEDRVLSCYPKYISGKCSKETLKQVMKVIEKYEKSKKTNPIEEVDEGNQDGSMSILSLMHWLLLDYYENGVYSNTKENVGVNNEGEILWEKTINETVSLIDKGTPYYVELLARKHISDEHDYCRLLHKYVLTEISKELKKVELLDLLGLTEVELTDARREDFGDNGYILYRIERELSSQFNTRKQLLLRNMYDYISQRDTLYDKDGFAFLGVTDFEYVWQDVCEKIMGNQLNTRLNDLPPFRKDFSLQSKYEKSSEKELSELLGKPKWELPQYGEKTGSPLIPDLVAIDKINDTWHFVIFDAKYYDADSHNERELPKNLPGVEDITKQYLYQLAYQPFIREHGFKARNCFLMPTEKDEILFGKVSMDMLRGPVRQMLGSGLISDLIDIKLVDEEMVELQDIKVRFLPAHKAYDYYINEEQFDISSLKLDSNE